MQKRVLERRPRSVCTSALSSGPLFSYVDFSRVATGQGKVREISFFFKVREKSGNFAKWSGKFQIPRKSENFLILAQNCLVMAGILSILCD